MTKTHTSEACCMRHEIRCFFKTIYCKGPATKTSPATYCSGGPLEQHYLKGGYLELHGA